MPRITTGLVIPLTAKVRKNNSISTDDGIFDLAAFLAVSARGTLEEGVYCGSLRLIDAIRKSIRAFPNAADDPFLSEISNFIDTHFEKDYLESEEKYVAFLDDVVSRFAGEILKRNKVDTLHKQDLRVDEKELGTQDLVWQN
jgi:hypothetical protein